MLSTAVVSNYFNIFLDFIMHNHIAQMVFGGAILLGVLYILIEGD